MSDSSIAPQPWESTPEGLAIAEAQWHRLAAAREEPDDLAHWWIRQGPRTIVAEECPAGSSRVVVRPLARFGATALDVEVARLIVEYRERPWLLCARPRSLEEHREFLDFFSALRKVIRSDYSYRVIRGDCSSEEIPEGTFVVAAEVDDWTFRYLQQVFEEIKRIAWAKLYLSAYTLEVNDGEDMVLIDRPDAPLLDGRPFRINEFNGRLWD